MGQRPAIPGLQAPTEVKAAAMDLNDGTHSRLSGVTGLERLKGDHIPKLLILFPQGPSNNLSHSAVQVISENCSDPIRYLLMLDSIKLKL